MDQIARLTFTLLATGSLLGHGWAEAQSPDPIRTRFDRSFDQTESLGLDQ
jgi:hypothetical protein